jgi:hypothetical protein
MDDIVGRTIYLLWAIVTSDVEDSTALRPILLEELSKLETEARQAGIPNLYATAVACVSVEQSPAS